MILDSALGCFIGADAVFLDTTYCHPKFVFPTQDESVNYVVDVVNQCDGDDVLFLVATYVVGKEKILLEIAKRFGKKVHVDARKMEVLRVLGYGESGQFTENCLETNIHVVGWNVLGETWPYFRPNFVKMKEIMIERGYSKVVGFVPTGWTYEVKRDKFAVRSKDSCRIHLVPYSEHSNYDELREYVKFLKPKRVIPTVGLDVEKSDSKHVDKMRKYFAGLVDETANKQEFLRGFKRRDSGVVGPESGKDVCDDLELGKSIEKEMKPSDVSLSSCMGETCVEDPALLNDEEKEKVIQELSCCLPTWVTRSQMLDLISISGSNIVEAVSNFFEREIEFHEQVNLGQTSVPAPRCCSSNDTSTSPISKSNHNDTNNTSKKCDIFPSQDSKMVNLRHPLPNQISPSKRKRSSETKSNKKVKVKAKSESSGSKQATITKFFSKAMSVMPGDTQSDQHGSKPDESPKVEELVPTDAGNLYKQEIDQFMQIINGDESLKKQVITIIENTKGDINKALDIYYSNACNLGGKEIAVQGECKIDRPLENKCVSQELRVIPDISMHRMLKDNVDATHVSLPSEKYNPKKHGLC
jgi:DNA ligase-1